MEQAELLFKGLDDLEVLFSGVGLVEDVEILSHQAHAAKAVVTLGHVIAKHQESRARARRAVDSIGRVMAHIAAHAMGQMAGERAVDAVVAFVASLASPAKNTAGTPFAVRELVAAGVGNVSGK